MYRVPLLGFAGLAGGVIGWGLSERDVKFFLSDVFEFWVVLAFGFDADVEHLRLRCLDAVRSEFSKGWQMVNCGD